MRCSQAQAKHLLMYPKWAVWLLQCVMLVRQAENQVTAAATPAEGSAMRRLKSETAGLPSEGPAVQADIKVCHLIVPKYRLSLLYPI